MDGFLSTQRVSPAVRLGYADGLLPAYVGLEGEDVQAGFALKLQEAAVAE